MPDNVTNIFISYGRADARELAIRLRDDLLAVGYGVWLDLNEIPGGASWSQNIEDAIEHCHLMLALMSTHSYNSQWCRAEQLRATRKGKRIVPLLVEVDAERPLHLEHINYLDFTEVSRYDEMFRDLLSDITAGVAFQQPGTLQTADGKGSPFKQSRLRKRSGYKDEKRAAPSFRRHLKALRQEDWLGARFWWPYFLFHFTDIHNVVDILKAEELASPFADGAAFHSRYDKFVRLYFRPRTPDLFHAEGFRPAVEVTSDKYAPIPVYLLFDLEAVICQPETRFAEGDPDKVKKTYKTASYFRDMPFEQIYHDSWFMPDERDEIMRCREAQALIPERIGLESLQLIWMRSPAEYETLHHIMPPELWHKWYDKITARRDYHLFNNKRLYVQSAILDAQQVRLRFNPCQRASDCGPFFTMLLVEYDDGERVEWQDEAYTPDHDLVFNLPRSDAYTVQLVLDGDVAYAGQYQPDMLILSTDSSA